MPTIQNGGRKWKSNYPHDKEVLDLIREKARCHRLWVARQNGLEGLSARQSYNQARNQVRKRTRQLRKQYELNIANQSRSNPKVFGKFARDRLKTKIGVAPLLCNPDDPGTLRHSDEEKADILQSQFCSVFTHEPEGEIPQLEPRIGERLEKLVITQEWVLKALMKTNITKSCGPDELHPRMLKELAVQLAAPMTKLFNQSLFLGEVPEEWKMANVSPIFKKGSRKVAANYRPVSLTSISSKIMEAAVRETILTHMKRNSLLSTRQFGFLGGRSTILQLLTFLDKCVDAISRGNVTDVVYLDFQKAFDTVPHKRLMVKLQAYGISGDILNWINAFLDGRTQRVIVNGIASREEAVLSGVPQGSVLGPLLFVVYINDLPDTLVGNCMMFADDTKSFREITDVADMNMMQNDLHLMEKWSKTWLLKFHPEKCVVMSVGIWWNIIQAYPYELLSTGLEHVLEEKDLGIIIDSELTFEAHIEAKLGTANQMLGLIRRSLTCCTAEIVIPLYKAFVRQHLEFGVAVWGGFIKRRHLHAIERIQMRATRIVESVKGMPYEERLRKLKLPTMTYRRARGLMMEVWKHINSYDTAVISPTFQFTRSARYPFQLKRFNSKGSQSKSFYHLAPALWNDLPLAVRETECRNTFKNRLDKHWRGHPMRLDYKASYDLGMRSPADQE